MTLTELHKKSGLTITLPTFRKIVTNEDSLKKAIKIFENGKSKRKTYLILDEKVILDFFKA